MSSSIVDGMILSDIHFPFHDQRVLSKALSRCKGKTHIYLLGDIIDAYSVSRFDKDPARKETLGDEIGMMEQLLLKPLREQNPDAEIYYFKGNHEQRIEQYIWSKAPELAWMDELKLENVLRLPKYDIQLVGRSGMKQHGVWFKHGDKVAKASGMTAKAELEDHWVSGFSGHCHRAGEYVTRKKTKVEFFWQETGCMCLIDPEYTSNPDWRQGWVELSQGRKKKLSYRFVNA